MKREQGGLLFSPSDLVSFVQSPFASWMQRLCLEVPTTKSLKDKPDLLMSYFAEKGLAHETRYLDSLEASAQNVLIIVDIKRFNFFESLDSQTSIEPSTRKEI